MTKHGTMSRRRLLHMAAMSVSGIVIAACAPKTAPTTAPEPTIAQAQATTAVEPTAATEPTKGHIKLTFWTDWLRPFFEPLLKQFHAQYTDMTIEFVPTSGMCMASGKLMAAVAGGTPPDANCCAGVAQFAPRGVLLPVDAILEKYGFKLSDYAEGAIKWHTWNGKLYAWPLSWDPDTMLYWNKDLFAAAGISEPPKTLEKMWDIADAFDKRASDGTIEQAAAIPWEGWYFNIIAYAHAYGNQLWNPETREIGINTPAMIQAMEYEQKWADRYGYESVSSLLSAVSSTAQTTPFGAGKLAMEIVGDWVMPDYSRNTNLNFAITQMPVAEGQQYYHNADGWSWEIPRGVKDIEASGLGLSRLNGIEYINFWCQNIGWTPAYLPARKDPSWTTANPHWPEIFAIIEGREADSWIDPCPFINELWPAIKEAENLVLTKTMGLQEAFKTAQEKAEKARADAEKQGLFGI